MARRAAPEPDIDRLYQLPLDAFTAERNALAKSAGPQGARIRSLQKPTVAAWAVNQLFWKARPLYEELVARAEDLRATHNAAVQGRQADLRGGSKLHDEAVEKALQATLALLAAEGQPATDATRQGIATTLRHLPGDEPPGRLTRPLEPRGFEALAGAFSRGKVRTAAARPAAKPEPPPPARPAGGAGGRARGSDAGARRADARKKDAARLAAAREGAAAASRARREAEHAARRAEFEAARAAREAERALTRAAEARTALEQARAESDAAEQEAARLQDLREKAQARAEKAAKDLALAEAREAEARTAVDRRS